MSESKDNKRKTFSDIFKNILKDIKKDSKPAEKESKSPELEKDQKQDKMDIIILKSPENLKPEKVFFLESGPPPMDDSLFSFSLKGGPKHTDVLAASSFLKESFIIYK